MLTQPVNLPDVYFICVLRRVTLYDFIFHFRFCPQKYHPFDATILEKYVVNDNYLPVWKVRKTIKDIPPPPHTHKSGSK